MDGGDSPRAKRTRYNQALDCQAAYGHQYCGLCRQFLQAPLPQAAFYRAHGAALPGQCSYTGPSRPPRECWPPSAPSAPSAASSDGLRTGLTRLWGSCAEVGGPSCWLAQVIPTGPTCAFQPGSYSRQLVGRSWPQLAPTRLAPFGLKLAAPLLIVTAPPRRCRHRDPARAPAAFGASCPGPVAGASFPAPLPASREPSTMQPKS